MTLTLRSASTTTATTKGAALTHAEMDANWLHLAQSSNAEFVQSGSGAIATTAQAELRNWVTPLQFGGVGNGTADDTAALALWIAAGATRNLYLPAGTWTTTAELAYSLATAGPLMIQGAGPNAILKATGVSNKVLHISGTAGVTINEFVIRDLAITSGTSGTSSAGLHLDGIAYWKVSGLWIDGNSKMTDGIRCTAAQQGEVAGGGIEFCTNGAVLEDNAGVGVRSNGIDWHGMAFRNVTTNLKVIKNGTSAGADTLFFRGNHLTSAAMQIDVYAGGGLLNFTDNVLEPLTGNNGAIVREGRTTWMGNTFAGVAGTTELNISGGAATYENKIIGNLFSADVTISAGSTDNTVTFNSTGGTCTDSGTRTQRFGNRAFAGTGFVDSLTLTDGTSGLPPLVLSGKAGSQTLGLRIGTGAQFYLQPVSTTDESLQFQPATGGTIFKLNKNGMVQGLAASNGPVGTVTLTANAASSTVSHTGVTAASIILLFPTSANAAADVGSATGVYISAIVASTSFTITHPNNANADKTFNYLVLN